METQTQTQNQNQNQTQNICAFRSERKPKYSTSLKKVKFNAPHERHSDRDMDVTRGPGPGYREFLDDTDTSMTEWVNGNVDRYTEHTSDLTGGLPETRDMTDNYLDGLDDGGNSDDFIEFERHFHEHDMENNTNDIFAIVSSGNLSENDDEQLPEENFQNCNGTVIPHDEFSMRLKTSVGEKDITALVDTGASCNALNFSTYEMISDYLDVQKSLGDTITTVDGSTTGIYGKVETILYINGIPFPTKMNIIKCGRTEAIIGRPFLSKYHAIIDAKNNSISLTPPAHQPRLTISLSSNEPTVISTGQSPGELIDPVLPEVSKVMPSVYPGDDDVSLKRVAKTIVFIGSVSLLVLFLLLLLIMMGTLGPFIFSQFNNCRPTRQTKTNMTLHDNMTDRPPTTRLRNDFVRGNSWKKKIPRKPRIHRKTKSRKHIFAKT